MRKKQPVVFFSSSIYLFFNAATIRLLYAFIVQYNDRKFSENAC